MRIGFSRHHRMDYNLGILFHLQIYQSTLDYTFDGFKPLRNDEAVDATSKCRPHHGLLTLVNQKHYIFCSNHFSSVSLEFTFVKTGSTSNPIQIVFLYRSSAFSFEMFKGIMTKELLPIIDCTMNLVIVI